MKGNKDTETVETQDVTELRVRTLPNKLHRKIRKYIGMVQVNEGRDLNKQTAVIELLEAATKNIKL